TQGAGGRTVVVTRRDAVKTLAAGAGLALAPRWTFALAAAGLELGAYAVSGRTVRLLLREPGAPATPDDGVLIAIGRGRLSATAPLPATRTFRCGAFRVQVSAAPLSIRVLGSGGRIVQEIGAEVSPGGGYRFSFRSGAAPLFGLGQGGPQLDKRGAVDAMGSGQGGYRLATHGAKVPIPLLWSAEGWGIFVHQPLCSFDLTGDTGLLVPHPDRGGHEPGESVPGAGESIAGLPAMPPLWSLGYQQSHRTLGPPEEIMAEAQIFRDKKLPCDVLIYLGTDFCPDGWNTHNGEFTWNPKAFPDPPAAIAEFHRQHFKVALHVVLEGRKLIGSVSDPCTARPL